MIFFNWKANGTIDLLNEINQIHIHKNVVIMPPLHLIQSIQNFQIGAQNVSEFSNGAYTGEITSQMLNEIGAKYCLVGHSERRQFFNETNQTIQQKIQNLTEYNIVPVLCIGESLPQRQNNQYLETIKQQMEIFTHQCIIAYEPIWSIGTGLTANNDQINEIASFIKTQYKPTKTLYGGSVSSKNISDLSRCNIDGVLVGGASLKPNEVKEITKYFI